MSTHSHTQIVPGCFRCGLSQDELPTPLEAAAAVIADGPAAFPSDTSTAREAIEAALDVVDLRRVIADHASWEATEVLERLRCSCGADLGEHPMSVPAYDIHHSHQSAMIRAAILGES